MRRTVRGIVLVVVAAVALSCARSGRSRTRFDADQTKPASEWLQIEPVRLLHEYVRLDTSEGKGEEPGALFWKRFFDCDGIENEVVCPQPGRCNLLARLPGKKRDGALLLVNHIDVAEPYAKYWREAGPFDGSIKKGYFYGRGAYDMKSIGVAQAVALRALKRRGVVPLSDVLFLAEADEESDQKLGSAWLLRHRPEWFRGVAAVLNEGGTSEMILRDVRFWGLETLQAGYASAELEASTEEPLRTFAARWRKLPSAPVEPDPQVVRGFEMLANHLPPPLTDLLRHLDRVRRDPAELAQLPDRYGSFLEPRILWSPPYGYPPEAPKGYRAPVVISVPPGMDPTPFLDAVLKDAARSGIRVIGSGSSGASGVSPYPTAFTEALRRVTEAHHPGVPFGPIPTVGGYTTSIFFRARGIPAYGYEPIPVNVVDAQRRHGLDERIYLRDFVEGVSLYDEIVAEWATAGPGK